MRFAFIKITLAAVLILAAAVFSQTRQPCTVLRVLDSCRVELDSGQIVRLIGIDSFPDNLPRWATSLSSLDSLTAGKSLYLEVDGNLTTTSSLIYGYLWFDSLLINEELLRRGLVQIWEDTTLFQYQKVFLAREHEAREAKRGLWNTDTLLPAPIDPTKPVSEDTVYVTKSGRKYHYANCRLLPKNRIALPLSKARLEYSPCRVCTGTKVGQQAKALVEPVSKNQCCAITKNGERCKRQAEPGSKYCWQHRRK
ncbi:MAG: thermonuclease family protein [candidate division KSB1 bacterium]|nr:thermonuclease family protein [candidate division KSB1 bacterium]